MRDDACYKLFSNAYVLCRKPVNPWTWADTSASSSRSITQALVQRQLLTGCRLVCHRAHDFGGPGVKNLLSRFLNEIRQHCAPYLTCRLIKAQATKGLVGFTKCQAQLALRGARIHRSRQTGCLPIQLIDVLTKPATLHKPQLFQVPARQKGKRKRDNTRVGDSTQSNHPLSLLRHHYRRCRYVIRGTHADRRIADRSAYIDNK